MESKRNLEKKVHPKPVFVRPAIQTRIRRATGIRTPRKERERKRACFISCFFSTIHTLLFSSTRERITKSRDVYLYPSLCNSALSPSFFFPWTILYFSADSGSLSLFAKKDACQSVMRGENSLFFFLCLSFHFQTILLPMTSTAKTRRREKRNRGKHKQTILE